MLNADKSGFIILNIRPSYRYIRGSLRWTSRSVFRGPLRLEVKKIV